ncbi:MAG: GFA family protein [Oleispira sp.]|nr:GFA family protein [Oleispira sp.]MBL4881279.1 GFA family protein [Oleispira sp.]
MTNKEEIHCHCECGKTQLNVAKPPMLRFHCHCTICQKLYKQPFSDVTVMWAKDAKLIQGEFIEYRRPGLLLKRGVCTQCEQPILATMTLFPGVKLAFVPANRYGDQSLLPKPSAHIFFHRSETAMDDGITKYNGFVKSELIISWLIVKSAFAQLFAR